MNETLQVVPEQEDEIDLRDYIAILKRRFWIIALSFVLIVCLTTIYLKIAPKLYEATTTIKLPSTGGASSLSAAISAFVPLGATSDIATEIEVIKGKDIAEAVIKETGYDKKPENQQLEWIDIIDRFRKGIKVLQKSKTNLIQITVTSPIPEEASEIANRIAEEYIRKSDESNRKLWNNLISQMETKLAQTRKDLERSRELLHQYESQKGITTAFSPILVGGGNLSSGVGSQYIVPEVPQAVAELKARIMQMEIQLDGLRRYYPEENPEIIRLKNQIAQSKQKLQQEESNVIDKYNKQFGLTKLAAEVVFNQQVYSSLVAKQEELKAQFIIQNKSPEIIERAEIPVWPVKPKKTLILLLGAVVGVFVGLGLALFLEFIDNTIHNSSVITKELNISVLGSIPKLKQKASKDNSPNPLLIMSSENRNSPWTSKLYKESFRKLQIDVLSSMRNLDNNSKGFSLMVTSALPGDGKSTISVNLALSMAQVGLKVLLIAIRPQGSSSTLLSEIASGFDRTDLINVLLDQTDVTEEARKSILDGLYVIGTSQDRDLLSVLLSPRLESFIEKAKSSFDLVIFDAPSVAFASESLAIGSKVDATIFVFKVGKTDKESLYRAIDTVQGVNGKILGIVANCAKLDKKLRKLFT